MHKMGDNFDEELQQREDALAEEQAVEDFAGGTNSSYYDDDAAYNYDDSSELTDVDYNPYDQSAQFTGGGTGTEAYNPVAQDEPEEDDEAGYGVGVSRSRSEDFTDDYDDEEYDFDGEENDEVDDEENPDEEDEDDEEGEGGEADKTAEDEKNKKQSLKNGQKGEEDEENYGPIKWKSGQLINLKIFKQTFYECRNLKFTIPPVELQIDNLFMTELSILTKGPNNVLKGNNWIHRTIGNKRPTYSLLKLTDSQPQRLLGTFFAAIEGVFDQQWMQIPMILGLEVAMNEIILKHQKIFRTYMKPAVRFINLYYKKKNHGKK